MTRKNRLFRAIGISFLRWAGYNIPAQSLIYVLQPWILETKLTYQKGAPAKDIEDAYNDQMTKLCMAAVPYVQVETKDLGTKIEVKYTLMVQRPDNSI